jgi:hypothetical protein
VIKESRDLVAKYFVFATDIFARVDENHQSGGI